MPIICILVFVVLVVAFYIIWIKIERARLNTAVAQAEDFRKEIQHLLTEEENAPDNGARFLRGILEAKGLIELDRGLHYVHITDAQEKGNNALINKWLKDNPDWILQINKLREFKKFRFKRDISHIPFPYTAELSALRGFFRIHSTMLVALAEERKFSEYLQLAHTLEYLFQHLDEPSLCAFLVYRACDSLLWNNGIGRSLRFIENTDVMDELIAALHDQAFTKAKLKNIIKGEVGIYGPWTVRCTLDECKNYYFMIITTEDQERRIKKLGRLYAIGGPYLLKSQANWLKNNIHMIDVADLQFPDNVNEAQAILDLKNNFGYELIEITNMIDFFKNSFIEYARANTLRTCWKTAMRIHKYKLEKGKLPDSIKEIKYYQQQGLPRDGFLGKLVGYKVINNPYCFRIKAADMNGIKSINILEPEKCPSTGKYRHERFGWQYKGVEETIVGIDYYDLPQEHGSNTPAKLIFKASELKAYSKQPEKLFTEISIRPETRIGKPTGGFIITGMKEDALLRKMGLCKGDVLVSVNGKSPLHLMSLLQSNLDHFTFEVKRNRKKIEFEAKRNGEDIIVIICNIKPLLKPSKDELQETESEEDSTETRTLINFNTVYLEVFLKFISRQCGMKNIMPDDLKDMGIELTFKKDKVMDGSPENLLKILKTKLNEIYLDYRIENKQIIIFKLQGFNSRITHPEPQTIPGQDISVEKILVADEGETFAVISGRKFREGDTVQDVTIVRIEKYFVIFKIPYKNDGFYYSVAVPEELKSE